jgi:hypothetical protein
MKVIGMLILSSLLVLAGCTTSYNLTSEPQPNCVTYDELVANARGERLTVQFLDGGQIRGELLRANPDSIVVHDAGSKSYPTRSVRSIQLKKSSTTDVVAGGVLGFAAGSLTLVAMGAGKEGEHGLREKDNDRYVILVGGGAGAVVGFIVGGLIDHTYEYTITNNSLRRVRTSNTK